MSLTMSIWLKRLPLLVGVFLLLGCTEPDANPEATVAPVHQVDVLAGDFAGTAEAYYSQQFPDATDVSKVRPGLVKLAVLWKKSEEQQATMELYGRVMNRESTKLQQETLEAMEEFVSYVNNGDTFAFREMFRLAACRLYVARARFDHAKQVLNQANSPDEMASAKIECQRCEGELSHQRMIR